MKSVNTAAAGNRWIKKTLALACLGVTCAGASVSAQADETLNLYNWGDYINPEVLERFTAETGIEVNLDTYSSNEEMLAKLQVGATGYDIVFPSVHMQDIMAQLGLLEKTGINQSPGFENIDTSHLLAESDPEGEYCLPYGWGSVGIVYNKTLVPELNSWKEFFALPDQGKKIVMLDDMREDIGLALLLDGNSVNSVDPDELKSAQQFLLDTKPKVSAFTYDSIPMVQSGDIAAAQWYVGAMIYVKEMPDTLAYVIPEEGATMYQENMCVLKTAPNKENAKRFLEFFLQPEISALNTVQQTNGSMNKAAIELLPDDIRNDENINPGEETKEKLQIFRELGTGTRLYDRVWTKFRTAS
ncbi:ABC transporter substrate-binding protein [Marinobacterium lutimaris]|uniref:Putrescine-binding periplasmic protein n=1 Tax=Marinobacterium lutimaris TaxID=568106 RepID=A0A1H5W2X3_9GAMM|nr:spermidine/putrescine ABC transporter substrate-binding protein [Marinobacterium lutimaris]SEF93859.1 spermidine/putrescine transport system substrate-binding protein [Marinobacterium lutimaris]